MIVLGSRAAGKRASRLRGALFFCPPDSARRGKTFGVSEGSTEPAVSSLSRAHRSQRRHRRGRHGGRGRGRARADPLPGVRQHGLWRSRRRSGHDAADRRARLAVITSPSAHIQATRIADGFGRRAALLAPRRRSTIVARPDPALLDVAAAAQVSVVHVKPHGALYNQAAIDCRSLVRHCRSGQRHLACPDASSGLPARRCSRQAVDAGLPVAAEAFADRAYQR